jgi:cephalosporin-C deacetylase-like acetyl esterase
MHASHCVSRRIQYRHQRTHVTAVTLQAGMQFLFWQPVLRGGMVFASDVRGMRGSWQAMRTICGTAMGYSLRGCADPDALL